MRETNTGINGLNVPGHLLFVVGFGVPDTQLTSQPFHALLRLEQVAEHAFQVVL